MSRRHITTKSLSCYSEEEPEREKVEKDVNILADFFNDCAMPNVTKLIHKNELTYNLTKNGDIHNYRRIGLLRDCWNKNVCFHKKSKVVEDYKKR